MGPLTRKQAVTRAWIDVHNQLGVPEALGEPHGLQMEPWAGLVEEVGERLIEQAQRWRRMAADDRAARS